MIMPGVIMVITTATIIMMIAIMVGIRGDGKGDSQVVSVFGLRFGNFAHP